MTIVNTNIYNFAEAFRVLRKSESLSVSDSDSAFGVLFNTDTIQEKLLSPLKSHLNNVTIADNTPDSAEYYEYMQDYEAHRQYLCTEGLFNSNEEGYQEFAFLGKKDEELAKAVIRKNQENNFLSQILVKVDISAPVYWWADFQDTLKAKKKHHKINGLPICFDFENSEISFVEQSIILDYQTIRELYFAKIFNKMPEWATFVNWAKLLPYSGLLIQYTTKDEALAYEIPYLCALAELFEVEFVDTEDEYRKAKDVAKEIFIKCLEEKKENGTGRNL